MLGGLFAASLAAFLVYGPRLDASTSGFALSQAISFSSMILVSSVPVSKVNLRLIYVTVVGQNGQRDGSPRKLCRGK